MTAPPTDYYAEEICFGFGLFLLVIALIWQVNRARRRRPEYTPAEIY